MPVLVLVTVTSQNLQLDLRTAALEKSPRIPAISIIIYDSYYHNYDRQISNLKLEVLDGKKREKIKNIYRGQEEKRRFFVIRT